MSKISLVKREFDVWAEIDARQRILPRAPGEKTCAEKAKEWGLSPQRVGVKLMQMVKDGEITRRWNGRGYYYRPA